MARTETRDRTSSMEEAFSIEEAPNNVPAAIQQVMIDDRPQGAMKVSKERDLAKVLVDIKKVATGAGDDFFYSWPTRNKDGTQGVVEGPSVKCANAVARIYGNCSVKVRAFDQGPHWIFYAQFYDMETGFVYERPFQQRKGQNIGGKMDKDRAADIVFQIGVSKAARNAVCNALSEFTDYAFDVAKEQLVEKIGKDVPKHLKRVLERLAELKVDNVRVERVRGKASEKWLAPDLARIIAEIQAVNDGMAHPDEIWPPEEAGAPRPKLEDEPDPSKAAAGVKDAGQNDKPTGADGKQNAPSDQKPAEQAKPAAEQSSTAADPKAGQPETVSQAATEQKKPEPTAEEIEAARAAEAEERAIEAFVTFEKKLEALKSDSDGLAGCKTAEEVEALKGSIRDVINGIADLNDEDKAVLHGRWNTMCLERNRALGKRKAK